MQKIIITGRIGKDAELRRTQQGDAVCGFSLAVDSRKGREKVTNWFRVNLWGKRGEALSQYLTKGSSVTVMGDLTFGEYEGKPQYDVRADDVALQGGGQQQGERRQTGTDTARDYGFSQQQEPHGQVGGGGYDDLDDEVPF